MAETKQFKDFYNTVREAVQDVQDNPIQSVQHVFVVRHGDRTDDDKTWEMPILRPWDPEITPRGIRRAYKTGLKIKKIAPIQHVASSPFVRCLQTADEISKGLRLERPITVNNGVGELMSTRIVRHWNLDRIANEGLVHSPGARRRQFGDRFIEDRRQPNMAPIGAGETRTVKGGGYQRFRDNIVEIADQGNRADTVIVTHGDGVAAAVSLALPDVRVYETKYCSFVHLVRNRSSNSSTWRIAQKTDEHGVAWIN